MSAALLPCPFCGEKGSLYVRHVEGTIRHPAYFVACDNCGSQGATTDKGDHKKEWNARAIAPPVAAGSVDTAAYISALQATVTEQSKRAEKAEAELESWVHTNRVDELQRNYSAALARIMYLEAELRIAQSC